MLLDGHDRLAACLAEGVAPAVLALTARRAGSPAPEAERAVLSEGAARALSQAPADDSGAVDSANRLLLRAYGEPQGPIVFRCWLLPGGAPAWSGEVEALLDAAGVTDPELREDLLLAES